MIIFRRDERNGCEMVKMLATICNIAIASSHFVCYLGLISRRFVSIISTGRLSSMSPPMIFVCTRRTCVSPLMILICGNGGGLGEELIDLWVARPGRAIPIPSDKVWRPGISNPIQAN